MYDVRRINFFPNQASAPKCSALCISHNQYTVRGEWIICLSRWTELLLTYRYTRETMDTFVFIIHELRFHAPCFRVMTPLNILRLHPFKKMVDDFRTSQDRHSLDVRYKAFHDMILLVLADGDKGRGCPYTFFR